MDITASKHAFDEEINSWMGSVADAVKKEMASKIDDYRHCFDRINSALTFFSPIAEELPIDQAIWIYNKDEVLSKSSSMQIIMEFLTQALYMEVSHLWPAANHSTRCALEHTFWTIWQIGYPKESLTTIGGPGQIKFNDMKDAVFEIPRYKKSMKKFEFAGDNHSKKNLEEKIQEVYGHLSYYVHTSNIHIEMKGTRPHITHDLEMNPKAERDTRENYNETFELIIILLSIACIGIIQKDQFKTINDLLTANIYSTLEEIISN